MRALSFLVAVMLTAAAPAEDYVGIFWNLESGESDAATIAGQMAQKGNVDFWGLSEVPDQAFLDTLVTKITAETGLSYVSQLSDGGNADRLAIIFNSDRLTSQPYSGTHPVSDLGDNFFELKTVQISSGLRPSLGVQLQDTDGQSVVVLVNHWKAFGNSEALAKRKRQAEATDVFAAMTLGIPIICAGDLNIPIKNNGQGTQQEAFDVLEQQFDYLPPTNTDTVGTHRGGSVLDAVFLANDLAAFESHTTILDREGNAPATTRTFSDSADDTDHRPLRVDIASDADDRIESLKEDISILEATLARMKQTLQQLEAARQ